MPGSSTYCYFTGSEEFLREYDKRYYIGCDDNKYMDIANDTTYTTISNTTTITSASTIHKSRRCGIEGLKSAYSDYRREREEPLATNYTAGFKGTLDYIFYTSLPLECIERMDIPSFKELDQETALPSRKHPSDHLPLKAVFIIKDIASSSDMTCQRSYLVDPVLT